MKLDTLLFIAYCNICPKHRSDPTQLQAPLQNFHVGLPLKCVTIDIVGSFP